MWPRHVQSLHGYILRNHFGRVLGYSAHSFLKPARYIAHTRRKRIFARSCLPFDVNRSLCATIQLGEQICIGKSDRDGDGASE